MTTDAIWKLLNEADDHQLSWSTYAWRQWFVRIVDAVSAVDGEIARELDAVDPVGGRVAEVRRADLNLRDFDWSCWPEPPPKASV